MIGNSIEIEKHVSSANSDTCNAAQKTSKVILNEGENEGKAIDGQDCVMHLVNLLNGGAFGVTTSTKGNQNTDGKFGQMELLLDRMKNINKFFRKHNNKKQLAQSMRLNGNSDQMRKATYAGKTRVLSTNKVLLILYTYLIQRHI